VPVVVAVAITRHVSGMPIGKSAASCQLVCVGASGISGLTARSELSDADTSNRYVSMTPPLDWMLLAVNVGLTCTRAPLPGLSIVKPRPEKPGVGACT